MTTHRYLEDFEVGQRCSGEPRQLSADDPADLGHFGPGALSALFQQSGGLLLDACWHYRAPIRAGSTLRFEQTVTRCRRTTGGENGIVTRHGVLVDEHGRTVRDGSVTVLVPARAEGPDPAGRAFCTPAWAGALAARLGEDDRFTSATGNWDGTIGLRCGDDEVQLRVYRGAVIQAAERTPHGATFTLGASERTWTELLTGPGDDLAQTVPGPFDVRGDGEEYLRLTRAIALLIEHARELAAGRGAV
ncbi:hotdog family protein [Prauserella flavalba]|uniref:Uncharacterized protein n=1 Tax=Prauserella flavalba TaxID=1477506 RepID=A0A318LGZ3_9PSEU|nr:hypothetical protein [Prauserella flavalba]PXY28602.1 hypothetical protein BA062_22325 [Prauserella flavalba]